MSGEPGKSEEQKVAEADVEGFRGRLGPFVVAAETTRMAMMFTDAKASDNPIIFVNDSCLSLFGHERDELLGHGFVSLMDRRTDPAALAQVRAAFAGDPVSDPEGRYRRKDGSEFWASLFVSPVKDDAGEVVQHFISFADLTAHKQEQARARMLIDELNHRVKNTLATVQSIVSQALRNSSDVAVIRESIESRLFALSRSHDLLAHENWESAGLLDVVRDALEPFGFADGLAERFTITGRDVRFPPGGALALGIAFHELATNAVKYGAFSDGKGRVSISWTTEAAPEGERLVVVWRETDGPPVTPPSRKGFGSRVIERGLTHELGGKVRLDYRAQGVVCTIDVPAPGAVRRG